MASSNSSENKLADLGERMAHLRAKSDGMCLLDHLTDVCRQSSEFVRVYRPEWPVSDGARLDRILAYASLMHDFGKIHPGFQIAVSGGEPFRNRHEILSLAFLVWLEIPANELPWVAAAIATHHKGWAEVCDRFVDHESDATDLGILSRGIPDSDARLLHELLALAPAVFADAGWKHWEPYPMGEYQEPKYGEYISRVLAVIAGHLKRIAPEARAKRPGEVITPNWTARTGGIHARGWLLSADHLASFGPQPIRSVFQTQAEVSKAYPEYVWTGVQLAASSHIGSGLLVSPTGSGKTEAALLWAARQAEQGTHGRIAMLLPYQTSLNAMQKRLIGRIDPEAKDDPDRWGQSVALIHGKTARHFYESFLRVGYAPGRAETSAREQTDMARLLVSPVAVSTVFSAIRLLFAPRGVERLMVAFSGARIVVDEIHAYTPEITALSLAALKFLTTHLGARTLFMSATVPKHLEDLLETTMGAARIPLQVEESVARHEIRMLPFDSQSDAAVEHIVQASESGSVLVVVNQVRRAVALRSKLEQRVATRLLHSRFHLKDRAEIERSLTPKKGMVLIGTQTVEVSLDLDFTTCFTELAPLESVAQRLGRCNRRGKQLQPAKVFVFERFPEGRAGHLPYDKEHLDTVQFTLDSFCRGGARILSDRDTCGMLDNSYPVGLRTRLAAEISSKAARLDQLLLGEWKPFGMETNEVMRQLEEQWSDLFDGDEVLPEQLAQTAKLEGSRLGASRYFVPIAERKLRQFWKDTYWDDELKCRIIRRSYDRNGLDLG